MGNLPYVQSLMVLGLGSLFASSIGLLTAREQATKYRRSVPLSFLGVGFVLAAAVWKYLAG